MNHLTKMCRRQRGSALVVVLLVITVFSILGLMIINVSFSQSRQFSKETTKTQATNSAEMGLKAYNQKINDVLKTINQNIPGTFEGFKTALDGALPNSLDSSQDQGIRSMQGNPEYEVTIGNENTGNNEVQLTVTSTGTVQGDKRVITQEKAFKYGNGSGGSSSGGDSDHTPEYMGLSLPYLEGSLIYNSAWNCSGNVKIDGQSSYCTGETKKAVDFNPIKTAFLSMQVPSTSPISGADSENGDFLSKIHFTNDVNFNGALNIYQSNVIFDKRVYVGGTLNSSGTASFAGDVYVGAASNISGNVTFNGNVYINAQANLSGTVRFNGNVFIGSQANLSGNISFNGNVYVGDQASVSGNVTSEGYFLIGKNFNVNANSDVHYSRTVYLLGDQFNISSSSNMLFPEGAVINGSFNGFSSGLILFGAQQHGSSNPPVPITVTTDKTEYN